jgi:hypothetical protein
VTVPHGIVHDVQRTRIGVVGPPPEGEAPPEEGMAWVTWHLPENRKGQEWVHPDEVTTRGLGA